jgi:hypothetical protein
MLYESVADLSVVIDDYDLEVHERATSSDFTRVTTEITLYGDGHLGRGEDVTYETEHHRALEAYDATLGIAGEYTVDGFSDRLDGVDLFPGDDPDEGARHYRRWGFESAALDLGLRQAGTDLGTELGRDYDPVRFVASTRLGDPPSIDRVERLLSVRPDLSFKLDPTPAWGEDLVATLADGADVRVLDLKAAYEGTTVDNPPDPDLYELVIDGFPDAILEDPGLTDETRALVESVRDRVSWDAPITGVESVEALPFEPSWLNVKPSRFGTLESLFETVEYAERHGIAMYGGGQFELGVGRGQVQALASLLYHDGPNDVAPRAYNDPEVSDGLAASPLEPLEDPIGFGF